MLSPRRIGLLLLLDALGLGVPKTYDDRRTVQADSRRRRAPTQHETANALELDPELLRAVLTEATLELELAITPDASVEHFAYQIFSSPPSDNLDDSPILWGELLIVDLTPGRTIDAELRLSTHDTPAILDALRGGEFGFGIHIEALEPVTFSPRAIDLQRANLELVASPLALLNYPRSSATPQA